MSEIVLNANGADVHDQECDDNDDAVDAANLEASRQPRVLAALPVIRIPQFTRGDRPTALPFVPNIARCNVGPQLAIVPRNRSQA